MNRSRSGIWEWARKGAALAVAACLVPLVAAQKPVTLRYACTDGAESLGIVKDVVAEFEKAHPNIRIKVEPVVDPLGYTQKLLAMTAGRVAPDVARMGIGEHVRLASRGALMPLDDFIAKDPSVQVDRYLPNALSFHRYEGKLYALPRSIAPTGIIFYNKRLFREAGLKEPDGTWTWAYRPRPELRERCFTWVMQHLTIREGKKIKQYGMAPAWPQLWFFTLLSSRDLMMWDSHENPTRMNALDPKVVELMQFVADTVKKDKWLPSQLDLSTQNTSVRDQFVQGRIAMYQSGPWEIRKFRQEMKDDWDMTLFPAYEGMPPKTFGEGNGTSIMASTRHPQEAWTFVKWMSGPPGMRAFARAGLDMPARLDVAREPGVWLPTDPNERPRNMALTIPAAEAMGRDLVPDWFWATADRVQGVAWGVLNEDKPVEKTLQQLQFDGTRDMANAKRELSRKPYPFLPALGIGIGIFLAGLLWVYWPERGRKLTLQESKENRSAYWFLLPWLAGLGLTFGPMIYSLLLSFAQSDIIQTPKWVGFQNYTDAFVVDDSVLISIRQTFLFAVLSIPIGTLAALGLALLLNQRVRGVPLFRALYYLPSLASGVAMSLIWMRIFNPETGLLNFFLYGPEGTWWLGNLLSHFVGTPGEPINWLGNKTTVIPAFVIMGLWGAGGGTIIFLAGLQGISQQYYEAATIDGAGLWRRFRNVTLPLLTPVLFFSLITGVIGALQVFTQAVVMTSGGPDRATLFYMVNLYTQAFGWLRMGYASALAWILFVIILIITVVQLAASKRWVFYEGEMKG